MSIRRIAALQTGLLLAAVLANAGSQKDTVRMTVLDSVTRASAPDNNGVPQNCEQLTFDAYCRSTSNVQVSTSLVQEDNQPPFRISCTVEKYSRCIPLPVGESFDARKEKHGLEVYYTDRNGKERKQLYTLVDAGGIAGPAAAAAAVATQPAPAAAQPQQSTPAPAAAAVPQQSAPAPATPVQSAPAAPVPAPSVGSVQAALPDKVERVKCNFSSTPAGADITLDGKYVGSTPSEIELGTGTHVVVFSMPGFTQWKRELTVLPGSVLTVSAILQKE
jgi:biotin carboxyl carrier protein